MGGKGLTNKFLRMVVLSSVVEESSKEFWEALRNMLPEEEEEEGGKKWNGVYWGECQDVIKAWKPKKGEPKVKSDQLSGLNHAQVAYILENLWREWLPKSTVKKITAVLEEMEIYKDNNMFYRWALSAIAMGDSKIKSDAIEYIRNNGLSPGSTALIKLLSKTASEGEKKELKNLKRNAKESSYVPWE